MLHLLLTLSRRFDDKNHLDPGFGPELQSLYMGRPRGCDEENAYRMEVHPCSSGRSGAAAAGGATMTCKLCRGAGDCVCVLMPVRFRVRECACACFPIISSALPCISSA